jgi:hypothetical protein
VRPTKGERPPAHHEGGCGKLYDDSLTAPMTICIANTHGKTLDGNEEDLLYGLLEFLLSANRIIMLQLLLQSR